jgi:hypothetical protein
MDTIFVMILCNSRSDVVTMVPFVLRVAWCVLRVAIIRAPCVWTVNAMRM